MKNCPAGQQYNAARSRCQEIITPTPEPPVIVTLSNDCPSGTTYNRQMNRCLTPAQTNARR
jgi:hypothetical protein